MTSGDGWMGKPAPKFMRFPANYCLDGPEEDPMPFVATGRVEWWWLGGRQAVGAILRAVEMESSLKLTGLDDTPLCFVLIPSTR
mmetsp:Transcript_41426/g.56463  ORF Transcript_41426/g.56463 Transcript_41426/m.56463 type:complete len:84 (+) Transcript_41426:780-1031(+)